MLSSPVEKTKQIEQSTTESSNKEYTIFENEQKMQPIYMNRQFNTGSINIWVSDRLFYIQPKNQTTGIGTIIKVDRATQTLSQLGRQQYQFDRVREQTSRKQDMLTDQKRFKKMQKLDYSLLIGIIDLSQVKIEKQPDLKTQIKKPKKVLFLAETVQLVCTINHRNIYKILKPVYIFFDPKDKQKLCDEQASLLLNLNLFFEQGMYYSYTYDLSKPMRQDPIVKHDINRQNMQTYSMENRQFYLRCSLGQKVLSKAKMQQLVQENKDPIKVRLSQKQEKEIHEQNNQFNWAQYLQKQLQNFDQRWRTAIIQGFVGKMQVHVKAEKFKLVLLTRRNRMNGGPLQFATGFSKVVPSSTQSKTTTKQNAKTANFTETQFIFHIKKYYYSFVQVRGTIPLHWKFKYSYGMVSGVEFEKTLQQNYRDFIQHFNDVRNKHGYDYVGMLNLLNSKGSQTKLIQNLEYIVKKCQNLPGLTYKYFDMHNRCPHKNFTKLTQFLIFELQSLLNKCSFSVFEVQASSTGPSIANKPRTLLQIHKQKGVIRTNCGTCIDRSNIVQSRIAALQLVYMLQTLDIKIHGISDTLHFIQGETPFAKLYRNMWADNGDAISQQYSGTSSMESVTVRMGKISYLASIDHGLTSLYRIVRNLREQDSGKWKAAYFLQQTKNETQHEKGNRNSMRTEQNSSSEYMH